ncbi:hypothetical protein LCGC14_1642330 [marine sediment metagenome]|uniref:Uncharacterized protein n=1 Tax=marine sediment metagenome TaxID=412755 RepID=A0A0F9KYZ3_9ZZZZ
MTIKEYLQGYRKKVSKKYWIPHLLIHGKGTSRVRYKKEQKG